MATELKQEPKPAPIHEEFAEPAGPPKSYRTLATLAFVSLILCQMLALYLVLPTKPPYGSTAPTEDTKPPDVEVKKPTVEKSIHEGKPFTVQNMRGGDSKETFTVKIDVAVLEADDRQFDARYATRTAQINDRVTAILTATSTEERQEAGHAAIKEKLKRGLNSVLGTPWVRQVYFSGVEIDVQQ